MEILTADIPEEKLLEKYAVGASKFVNFDSFRIHYRDEGNQNGPTIVMLHGSQSPLHTWEAWVKELEKDFRMVSLDLPGHGFTSVMPDDDYTYPAITRVLHRFVRALKLPKFTLVGNSYGGVIAVHYAAWYESDLTSLVLIDSAGYPVPDPLPCQIVRWPLVGEVFTHCTPRDFVRKELESCYGDKSKCTDAMFERYYELMLLTGRRRAQLLINKPDNAYWAPSPVLERLTQLKIPALVMWGEKDPWLETTLGQRFADDIPDATLKIYKGAGHVPMEEQPAESAADLREFLNEKITPQKTVALA